MSVLHYALAHDDAAIESGQTVTHNPKSAMTLTSIVPLAGLVSGSVSFLAEVTAASPGEAWLGNAAITGGLTATLTVLLVRWMLGQYEKLAQRLASMEESRVALTERVTEAMTKSTAASIQTVETMRALGETISANSRHIETLATTMHNRPCLKPHEHKPNQD